VGESLLQGVHRPRIRLSVEEIVQRESREVKFKEEVLIAVEVLRYFGVRQVWNLTK
jgi:hypothetical protein